MKHTWSVTLLLVVLFLAAQYLGLLVYSHYATADLPFGIERPELEPSTSFLPLFSFILLATLLALLFARFNMIWLWKAWFFLSVLLALTVAFAAFLPAAIALPLGVLLAAYKVYRPNLYIHNLTELFIYGGIAAIFTPVFSVFSASLLLLLISVYDGYAVWKSKHMIALAKFQTEQKVFAGLFIPYGRPRAQAQPARKEMRAGHPQQRTAILGGGDIAFPLIFAGAVMKSASFWLTLIIPLAVTAALLLLFLRSEKGKFYPAMPFLSAGCFVGYGIMLLL